jgi:hypothetical protein
VVLILPDIPEDYPEDVPTEYHNCMATVISTPEEDSEGDEYDTEDCYLLPGGCSA